MQIQCKLKVDKLWREDIFKDIARIHKEDRGDIHEGRVCVIIANGHTKRLIVRGIEGTHSGGIKLDEVTREAMRIENGISYDFSIKEVGIIGNIRWACNVADGGVRISAWIGIVSVLLGIAGILLGGIGVWIAVRY